MLCVYEKCCFYGVSVSFTFICCCKSFAIAVRALQGMSAENSTHWESNSHGDDERLAPE